METVLNEPKKMLKCLMCNKVLLEHKEPDGFDIYCEECRMEIIEDENP